MRREELCIMQKDRKSEAKVTITHGEKTEVKKKDSILYQVLYWYNCTFNET